jgi:ketosteroid isomerase-like protein
MAGYGSAADAETAFYQAFALGNMEQMRQVWADLPDVFCVHPGGERVVGRAAVLASWQPILQAMERVIIDLTDLVVVGQGDITLHHVREQLFVNGSRRGVILATNAYLNTEQGWKLTMHHASPDPAPPQFVVAKFLH